MDRHKLGRLSSVLIATTALTAAQFANAATLPLFTGPSGSNPINFPAVLPDMNSLINSINSGITPVSMAPYSNFRNYLDNGALAVVQRAAATSAVTGGATGGCVHTLSGTSYVADRWCVDTNVTSGAGTGIIATSSPTAPVGFSNVMKVYRASGTLTTASICTIQEIPTSDATQLQGQSVTFSAYLQALGGLNADTGNVVSGYIIYGTGTDPGLTTMSAPGTVTPNWSGINATITTNWTLSSTAWGRFSLTGVLPSTATVVGVEICFLPTSAGTAGTTDGFAFTGAQLEIGTAASSFEFRPLGIELSKAQRYYYEFDENATTAQTGAGHVMGQVTASTTANLWFQFPVQMRATPTAGYVSGFAFTAPSGASNAAAATFTTLTSSASPQGIVVTATTSGLSTAGQSTIMINGGNAGVWAFSADF